MRRLQAMRGTTIAAMRVATMVIAAIPLAAFPAQTSPPEDGPERAVTALWRAMSNDPGESPDVAALRTLFHPQAIVFGSRLRDGLPALTRTEGDAFLERMRAVGKDGFHECEIARTVDVHDRFATVYSVVESRAHPDAPRPDFTGVNSLQWYRTDDGWRLLSLYYHVATDDRPIAHDGTSGRCID